MPFRLILSILFLFLILNLPFIDIKKHKKSVYLYHNSESEIFLKKHPELKNVLHLTRNKKLKPLLLITSTPLRYDLKEFSLTFVTSNEAQNTFTSLAHIPTHAIIGDTLYFNTQPGTQFLDRYAKPIHRLPINGKHNFVNVKLYDTVYRIDIRGIYENAYVIDTVKDVAAYHGALRRYFDRLPFISYVEIMRSKKRTYNCFKDSIVEGDLRLHPVLFYIGKHIEILNTGELTNPDGFYLAFKDTILPVPITVISTPHAKNFKPVAFIIGKDKIPFAYTYGEKAFIATAQIDMLSRSHPHLFNSIMDSLLKQITTPQVSIFPDKHFVYEGTPLKLSIMCIPFCTTCSVIHAQKEEPCIEDTSFLYTFTFTPSIKDTIIFVKVDSVYDTVFIHVLKRNNHITFDENEFVDYIRASTYSIQTGLFYRARNSTIFYFILLFILILTWFYEKRRKGKD